MFDHVKPEKASMEADELLERERSHEMKLVWWSESGEETPGRA